MNVLFSSMIMINRDHFCLHLPHLRFLLQLRFRVLPFSCPTKYHAIKQINKKSLYNTLPNKSPFRYLLSHSIGNRPQDSFHHRQMLPIVVRLEQCHSEVQFKHDTTANRNIPISTTISSSSSFCHSPYRPHITRLRPAQLQDHLGRPVMSGRHNCTVVLVVKGGAAKVNQTHVRALDPPHHA